ncbi:hypothetical protein CEN50_17900 [Fischerella thermalis CCMEE 5268]|uniref:Porin n=1 Tax=Fischerella thermalis CCMEE 5268 TaxID=2019662 RepID=A0A2N6KD33_9CYAN|nr:hypothetical protein [Fischerella thermalis]PLZ96662.1 hypothetical protein CEN50_17900 [Fischerella thermalis CCMEE 5268]
MKRRISLIIGFALSLLMMFSPVAMADEVQGQTSVTTSELSKSEVVKVTPTEKKEADASVAQPKASDLLDKGKLNPIKLKPFCNVTCPGGAPGYMSGEYCLPC